MKFDLSIIIIVIAVIIFLCFMGWGYKKNIQTVTDCADAQVALSELQTDFIETLSIKVGEDSLSQEVFDNLTEEFLQQAEDLKADCGGQ